jgi:4-alpha-glucanotransferase
VVSPDLAARAAAHGVATEYEDGWHKIVQVPEATVEAAIEAMAGGPGPSGGEAAATSPAACFLPDDMRIWGWAVQLYSARSADSWGIGDLGDLRRLADWSAGQGAKMIIVNPLHAGRTHPTVEPSPYYPTSRRFRHPIYLRLPQQNVEAGALNDDPHIDRDRIWPLKLAALERMWAAFAGDERFDRYVAERGKALEEFALFCALTDVHGGSWREWPAELQHASTPAVAQFAREHHDKVRFHQWLQWMLEDQLMAVASRVSVIQDLAVGIDPNGADAWALQDLLAPGMRVGAPPDMFNPDGQDWGLPAFDPWRLRAAEYVPFADALRANMVPGGGIRIDHILGLFRLFWIPEGADPHEGTYVKYPHDELFDVVARESQAAGAFAIGEDLGTVPPGVHETMQARKVLSYRLFWFEEDPPAQYPFQSLAAVTTHDLPTITGVLSGSDPSDELKQRIESAEPAGASVQEIIEDVYGQLAEAPSAIVAISLEDGLGVAERPNHPGTVNADNWSRALPLTIEGIEQDNRATALAAAVNRRRTAV